MKALITGGTGFVGLALGAELAAQGATVTLADVRTDAVSPGFAATVTRADLSSWPETMRLVKQAQPDVIFHTAALLSAAAEEVPLGAYQANTSGTFHVLEAAVLFDVPQVVFLSSIASYGPGVADVVDEQVAQRPITVYGITKVVGELLGEYYARRFGVDFRAARYPSIIGPGRGGGGASAYSSAMIEEPARDRPYAIPVPPQTVMPLLYVDDAVRSLVDLAAASASQLSRRTYGIGGFSPTAGEVADAVRLHAPDARLEFAPEPETTAIVESWPRVLSGAAAAADWGWKPRFLLDETVRDFVGRVRAAGAMVS
ncbi:MAG: NAD-dependent epimerase/dehydratase family protein [Acidimicrobiales bacterium]